MTRACRRHAALAACSGLLLSRAHAAPAPQLHRSMDKGRMFIHFDVKFPEAGDLSDKDIAVRGRAPSPAPERVSAARKWSLCSHPGAGCDAGAHNHSAASPAAWRRGHRGVRGGVHGGHRHGAGDEAATGASGVQLIVLACHALCNSATSPHPRLRWRRKTTTSRSAVSSALSSKRWSGGVHHYEVRRHKSSENAAVVARTVVIKTEHDDDGAPTKKI